MYTYSLCHVQVMINWFPSFVYFHWYALILSPVRYRTIICVFCMFQKSHCMLFSPMTQFNKDTYMYTYILIHNIYIHTHIRMLLLKDIDECEHSFRIQKIHNNKPFKYTLGSNQSNMWQVSCVLRVLPCTVYCLLLTVWLELLGVFMAKVTS